MGDGGERFAVGETVFLSREVRAAHRIHEIGTRAHVLEDNGAMIALHLDGADAEVVTCPSDSVASAAERVSRTPVPRAARVWLGPATG